MTWKFWHTTSKSLPETTANLGSPSSGPVFKIIIADFYDNISNCGATNLANALSACEGLRTEAYLENFDHSFLNLESRNIFDLIDTGQSILKQTQSDIIIWGYRDNDKMRLNFQNNGHYDENGILVPENDHSKVKAVKIRRRYENYFRDAGIPKRSWQNPDGYDSDWDSAHPWYIDGYMSMSNATDYAYIDETNGNFVVTDQYASNNNQYWYQIDEDDGPNWHAYKRITWNARTWSDK